MIEPLPFADEDFVRAAVILDEIGWLELWLAIFPGGLVANAIASLAGDLRGREVFH